MIPAAGPPPNPTVYMQGTRRIDEMAKNARQLAFQQNYSYTEGWDDNTVAEIFNLALNQVYDKICQVDNPANIDEYTQDVISGVQAYDIPQDVNISLQLINVRYLYGPQTWQFVTLYQSTIQDRFSYPTNIPSTYCIRDGQILLSPTPNISRAQSLIINFQHRMRSLDFRRGKVNTGIISTFGNITTISNANPAQVTTQNPHGLVTGAQVGLGGAFNMLELINNTYIITVTGANTFTLNGVDTTLDPAYVGPGIWYKNPVQFQLNFTATSQKDVNLQPNANSLLNLIDWACIVDRNGNTVIDAIPVNNYNMTTFVLTAEADYVIPYTFWLNFLDLLTNLNTLYVVTGDYASTHSTLDRKVEDLLIEYVVLRLLRLQSAAEPTINQLEAEENVLNRIAISYRRYRPSVNPIIWQKNLKTKSFYWGGRGAY